MQSVVSKDAAFPSQPDSAIFVQTTFKINVSRFGNSFTYLVVMKHVMTDDRQVLSWTLGVCSYSVYHYLLYVYSIIFKYKVNDAWSIVCLLSVGQPYSQLLQYFHKVYLVKYFQSFSVLLVNILIHRLQIVSVIPI